MKLSGKSAWFSGMLFGSNLPKVFYIETLIAISVVHTNFQVH